ncbi:Na-translocating system protein MpsC family protein [Aquibacillus rhizosphaerae]|uniref:Na-translocating system protein MpsC family protein n=1 Tax=Aquibacillus rhizosphaerae TaxID=3051431 RepID=A0ABT7L7G4_9BACI|nr:Na-translocating system protein MpsC family protein [Aquibacillus sp. LR5S19]MDL4841802.1 Na-translocating system protein MpsC family protein [Aquibacillus sp. LR5S19]
MQITFNGKKEMDNEITHVSRVAERVPDELNSYMLNSRTFLFIRNGILVNIEKQLIRDGHQEILKLTKRKLEKKLLHNNSHFGEYLSAKVIDIFVDWDFDRAISVILFIVSPTDR